MYFCTKCGLHCCDRMELSSAPEKCPSRCEPMEEIRSEYLREENFDFGRACSIVSMSASGQQPRILEFIEVAERCGYKKIGLAFCIGLSNEAKILTKVLEYHGFTVESVVCKIGGIDKNLHGIENGGNAMCNPIGQAVLLNKQKTEFNIALGLCVGHDSLFFKYSEAPVTVLAAKDKVLAHNPMGALYHADGYYRNVLFPFPK